VKDNVIHGGAVTGTAAVSWGVVVDGAAELDANVINQHRNGLATCSGATPCGGVLVTSGDPVITNNVIFGATAARSFGLYLQATLGNISDAVVSSNYVNGGGVVDRTGSSTAIGLAIGACPACSPDLQAARIRNNILDFGIGASRAGLVEEAGQGQTIHPGALESNDFFKGGDLPGIYYRVWDGATSKDILTAAGIDGAGISGPVSGNFDENPLFDMASFTLDPASPCVNRGTSADAPPTDREGDPRPLDDTTAPDIGPDEVL
jgi:hypothetical protein